MTATAEGWQPGPIAGFRRWERPGHVLVVADAWVDSVAKLGLAESGGLQRTLSGAPGTCTKEPHPAPSGRGPTAVVELPGSDSQLHLRPVRHGGWFGGILGGALVGLDRPLDELRVTAALRARGAPVPSPVLVVAERTGPLWSAAVGTVFEPGTVDGLAFLSSAPAPDAVLEAAAAAGRAINCFHQHGGSHPDLHLGNLLVRVGADGETEVVVVDLDRAALVELPDGPAGATLDPSQRMRELMRLKRSLVKRGFAATVGTRGEARFFAAYTDGDRTLRRKLLAHSGRERLRIALHATFYSTPS